MKFLEKDLEEIIYTADRAELRKRGLNIKGKLYRQLRIGNYGIADLVEVDRMPRFVDHSGDIPIVYEEGMVTITVYELKKENINVSTFLQALGYAKGIKNYIEDFRGKSFRLDLKICLIGSSIDKNSSFSYMPSMVPENEFGQFLTINTYDYSFDGIKFKEEYFYSLKEEGFKCQKK